MVPGDNILYLYEVNDYNYSYILNKLIIQASIRSKTPAGHTEHVCGAVIISKYHILTAAHCVRDLDKDVYYVRIGDFNKDVSIFSVFHNRLLIGSRRDVLCVGFLRPCSLELFLYTKAI